MGSNIAARAATAGELTKFRSEGQRTKLGLAIQTPVTVYTMQIDQTFDTLDGVAELTYDNGSGTLANVLPGMTVFVGSTAGARDKGILRVRKAPTADTLYIGQVSHIQFEDDDHLTVVNTFSIWPRDISIAGGVPLMDYDIPYGTLSGRCIPRVGPIAAVLKLVEGEVTFNPPDPTDSECYDGTTIQSYLYAAPGASSTSNMNTSTPEWTYDTPGTYRWSCTITDTSGRETKTYRWIFVDPDPVEFELASNPIVDWESGFWSFSVTLYENATTAEIYERALVVLYSDDEYYGGVAGSIGKITNYENIECVGWIDGESITRDPDAGLVTFTVRGPGFWLGRMRAFPFELQDTSSAPTNWKEIEELTVDKGLAHLLFWMSTAPLVMDCYFTGDETRKQIITEPSGSLLSQLNAIALNTIFAKPLFNNLGQMYVEIDQQIMDPADRVALPVVMDLTSVDFIETLNLERSTSEKACTVELGGYEAYDGSEAVQVFARAPGVINPITFGEPRSYNNYIFPDQDECNRVAGALLAMVNNEFEPLEIQLSANNRLIDITPRMVCTLSLAAGDTPRGVVLSTQRLIPRRVERAYDKENSVMLTNITFEFETTGVDGITYIPPVVGDNIPDLSLGGFGGLDFPDGDLGDWFPDTVPPEVTTDCATAGLNQFVLPWDTVWLIGDGGPLIARCYFPCAIRSSFSVTTLYLDGFWHGDAPTHYNVYGVKDGTRILTASVSQADHANVATFSPLSDTIVDGFEIELDTGIGSDVTYQSLSIFASGNVAITTTAGTVVSGLTIGQAYGLHNAGGPWYGWPPGNPNYAPLHYLGAKNHNGKTIAVVGDGLASLGTLGEYGLVMNAYYSVVYFVAEATTITVWTTDPNPADNTGSLKYILDNAQRLGRMIQLGPLTIKNVCAIV